MAQPPGAGPPAGVPRAALPGPRRKALSSCLARAPQAAIVAEERRRLLAEAAGLLGHLPPGVIKSAEEMEYVRRLAGQAGAGAHV